MLPVKKSTAFNLITNLGMVVLTAIDIRAGVITALLMFVCECGGNMHKRQKKLTSND